MGDYLIWTKVKVTFKRKFHHDQYSGSFKWPLRSLTTHSLEMLLIKNVSYHLQSETLYIWLPTATSWLCEVEQLISFLSPLPALSALNISLPCYKEKAGGGGM